MKTRESGMPPEELWQSFFDPETTLVKLGLTADCQCVVDFGCGYGTFSVPAARIVRGTVHALDIDPHMIEATMAKAKAAGLTNLLARACDFVESGCGLADGDADYVMLFNILHAAEAKTLLAEARRVLKPGATLALIHWNYDPATPRGPSLDIRLQPEQCMTLVREADFTVGPLVDLPPFHFGFVARKAG